MGEYPPENHLKTFLLDHFDSMDGVMGDTDKFDKFFSCFKFSAERLEKKTESP